MTCCSCATPSLHSIFANSSLHQNTQLLVVDVASGGVILNSKLAGLAQQLRAADGFLYVWAIDFLD